jgi:predicted transposase/invertase (TIGR01784 family)
LKTDSLWFELFARFPQLFFELGGENASLAEHYNFGSVEVKHLAFRIDGVFLPAPDHPQIPICFCEVQFQADENFYSRLFTEIFIYLRQHQPAHDWRATIIYAKHSTETPPEPWYSEFFASGRVQRIYLEDFGPELNPILGIGIAQLIVSPEAQASAYAKMLIAQAKNQIQNPSSQREFIELIETILVYKFPHKSREEIEAMLRLSELKQSRVYQEAKQEGVSEGEQKVRQEIALKLLGSGLSPEEVSDLTELPLAEVQRLTSDIRGT